MRALLLRWPAPPHQRAEDGDRGTSCSAAGHRTSRATTSPLRNRGRPHCRQASTRTCWRPPPRRNVATWSRSQCDSGRVAESSRGEPVHVGGDREEPHARRAEVSDEGGMRRREEGIPDVGHRQRRGGVQRRGRATRLDFHPTLGATPALSSSRRQSRWISMPTDQRSLRPRWRLKPR